MRRTLTLLACLALPALASASAGPYALMDSFPAPTPEQTQVFALSVAIDGDVMVVGAPGEDDADNDNAGRGAAYVYRFDGSAWGFEQRLVASDGEDDDDFGFSVSVDDQVIVVGVREPSGPIPNRGAAYVYRFDGAAWVEEEVLDTADGSTRGFGASVDVCGDVIVVGARTSSVDGSFNAGRVHVYRFGASGWIEETAFESPTPQVNGLYGTSVAVDGDVVVVGGPRELAGPMPGFAAVWRFDGAVWGSEGQLFASDAAGGDEFGQAVSVDGDRIVVGAPRTFIDEGAAYLFRYDAALAVWSQSQRVDAPAGAPSGAGTGSAVALEGSTALVYAPLIDSPAVRVLREAGGLSTEQDLAEPDPGVGVSAFGLAVDASGPWVVAGAALRDEGGQAMAGRVFVYYRDVVSRPDLDGDGEVGSSDLGALLSAWGPCP